MNSKLIKPAGPNPRFSAIERPASTPAFLDSRVDRSELKVDPNQPDVDLGQPGTFASRFAARHSGGGNIAYCDGHVVWEPGIKVVETRPGPAYSRGFARFPDNEIIWSADPFFNPNY